jgi:C1A family cysteine protease
MALPTEDASLPTEVNWVTKGALNPIKNQGQCGSCYTFGSTCVVEAAIFIAGFTLPNLSEQQIVSCSE